MKKPLELKIDYPVSWLCTIESPSFYPLNQDWGTARGSAYAGAKKVFICIDQQGWVEAEGTINWTHRLNGKALSVGTHSFAVQLFDGNNLSGILRKDFNIKNSESRSDLESIEAAAFSSYQLGWLDDGRFAGGASPSFPVESIHMGLAPFFIGCLNLHTLTKKEVYKTFAYRAIERMFQKQLPNGGIHCDRIKEEEPLESALAAYCFELACFHFPSEVLFQKHANLACKRIVTLMQSRPFLFWYPYEPANKIPFHCLYQYGKYRTWLEKSLWNLSPDVSFRIHELLGNWRTSVPIPNFQARALAVLAQAYQRTKDATIGNLLWNGLQKFFSLVPTSGAIKYCRRDPSVYLYYIAWAMEPILEVLTILRQTEKIPPLYEKLAAATVNHLLPHLRPITDSSTRFFFDDCCKFHRLQGGGQGSTLCLWEAISFLSRYCTYVGEKNPLIRYMVNYAKTLQNETGLFPIDESGQIESSLWGTCTYLRNASIALLEGSLD